MNAALKFKQTHVARQTGELARIKVVQGPDYGHVYVITGPRASIGRGDENDLVIADLKASRKHAEFILGESRRWSVVDLGSANGIEVNAKNTRDSELNSGDTVTVGETILEFMTPEAGTLVLVKPAKTPDQVKKERASLDAQKNRIRSFNGGGTEAKKKAPLPVIIGGALIAGYLLLSGNDKPKQAVVQKAPTSAERDLNSYLPQLAASPGSTTALEKTADQFFKAGFREYREHNYLRAKIQFESALQVNPSHSLANLYLDNCNKQIEDEVQFHQDTGRKSYEAGKVKEAKSHFEAILRLLYRDPMNAAYVDAKEELEKITKEEALGGTL